MAPSPQETVTIGKENISDPVRRPLNGDEVVISGLSGVFPKSDNTMEFMENLFNKVDMVADEESRWEFNHPEVPKHLGKISGIRKFDAQFFRVHYRQACVMEPMSRKLLEHAYGALYDAGINPIELRGKKVGVFIGSTFSDTEKQAFYETVQRNGFGITGCNRAMYANRISYWIDGKGPSYSLDVSCSSSMAALEHAYRSISTGQCEAAIVGGCNICMHPNVSLNLKRAGFLCLDGKTKSFDKNGDGFVRSDAINVVFVQKAKDAKRIYSEVYFAKGMYKMTPGTPFLPVREEKDIREFLEAFYAGINVSPTDIEYVEAHASGLADADVNELEAIGKVFGKVNPIKVGSVKSNMGHGEAAAGICAITKVCLAYHKGKLPANLHYNNPPDISSVRDGKVDVLQEVAPFNRGFVALNSFSYGGVNFHTLLKGHYKPKDVNRYKSSFPRLVLVSGRQESCVKNIFNTLKSQPVDPEQLGLFHSFHEHEISGHMCRGYSILDTKNDETVCLSQKIDYFSGITRPIWFVYSGMGSQWAGMGTELMKIPIFAAAIDRCHKVLEPKGLNIVQILTEPDKTIYDNILNSFVGIAAVQIGLTDILKALGIFPDKIIGHSVGELGCAYADGCFTAEEMILSAYSRGLVSIQTPFIRGSMAAVGLGYKAVLAMCPPEIEVACHNSSTSSTISGPAEIMKDFVAQLTGRGIFAKEVPCSNIAYHSKYIASAGPDLLKYLSQVIKDPKPRSEKWVSTSVPQEHWDEPKAKYSSAEYHTNNLLNSVLFDETARLIPSNAIMIEIAPHGLLQAILKRSHNQCIHIPLTRRGHTDSAQYLLEAFGKMYQEGLNPKIKNIYPKIEYPVSTETPMLSQFVEWEHSEDWPHAKYNSKDRAYSFVRKFAVSIHDDDHKYLEGHVRDEKLVFPEAGLLVLIWETFAMKMNINFRELSVTFRDVQFMGEAHIKTEEPLRLHIMIHKSCHRFEVSHDGVEIVTGTINIATDTGFRKLPDQSIDCNADTEIELSSEDVYKVLRLRGYNYKDSFKSILSANNTFSKADIRWDDEWVTFLDSLIQLSTLATGYTGISKPVLIRRLDIDVDSHKAEQQVVKDGVASYKAKFYSHYDVTRCAGIEISNIKYADKLNLENEPDVLLTKMFVPHFLTGETDVETALLLNLQIIAENVPEKIVKVTEIVDKKAISWKHAIEHASKMIPADNFSVNFTQSEIVDLMDGNKKIDSHVYIVENLLGDKKTMENLVNSANTKNVLVLAIEDATTAINSNYEPLKVISSVYVQKKVMILLKNVDVTKRGSTTYIPVTHDSSFSWVRRVTSELERGRKVTLVAERQIYSGLLGLVKNLSKDYMNKIGIITVDDYVADSFHLESDFYKEQLDKDLTVNILRKGQWGGHYYLPNKKSVHISNVQLTSTIPGDIDSLTWTESPSVSNDGLEVQVYYTGPSFRDAQKAVGNVNNPVNTFGMDFSGVTNKGTRVMGVISGGAMASKLTADEDLLWPVPDHWTLEDAATVPLPYLHAYYCLALRDPIYKSYSVFVNGGAGALGQAVISIALALDCTVYTTVSTVEKKRFLMKLFPQLKADNITFSRHDTFYNKILQNSEGLKCHHVISSLSGSLREAAMKCVGTSSFFIDISETDMTENKGFGMNFLVGEKNYKGINVANLFEPENADTRKKLQILIAEGISTGIVKPLSRVVYSPNEVTTAFRLLSSSRHRGRVLIRMRDPATLSQGLNVRPRISYSSKASYVIICDDKGVGIELADRLIKQGVKKLNLHLKNSEIGGYLGTKIMSWAKQNVHIKLSSDNLQTEKGCVNLLNASSGLGPVEGIFIVQDNRNASFEQDNLVAQFNDTGMVLANVDLVSRDFCAELKYFVVMTREVKTAVDAHSVSISEKVCQTRNDVGLPASVFHMPSLVEFDEIEENSESTFQPLKLSTAFNALEICMKLSYDNVLAFNVNEKSKFDFLQKVARVLGVEKIDDVPQNLSLEELNVTEVNVEEIKTALKKAFKCIDYSAEAVKQMTITDLREFGQEVVKTTCDTGLDAFYTFIEPDECTATEPIITMPTKLSNGTENEEELDTKATYLMLIPGFEGHHQIFFPISERVKVAAMAIQLGPDVMDDSIHDMAVSILKSMKKRFEFKTKFYFLGYSFGVNIALELAALLEKEGHVGVVYCLDSSPDVLRAQLDAYLGNLTDPELQDMIVEHLYKIMTGEASAELRKDLDERINWNDKIEACVNRLRGLVKYSNQYKRSILQLAYKRIKMARDYQPEFKLESEVVLMKGIPHPKAGQLPEDYNLSKYTTKPVQVFNLKSDHADIINNSRVSNVINKFLDPKLLEEFKNKNLCETYLADPFKIL